MLRLTTVLQKLYVTAQVLILAVCVIGGSIAMLVSVHDYFATQSERKCVEKIWSSLPQYTSKQPNNDFDPDAYLTGEHLTSSGGVTSSPSYPVQATERAIKACGNVDVYTNNSYVIAASDGVKVAEDFAFDYYFRDAWGDDRKHSDGFRWGPPLAFGGLALLSLCLALLRAWLVWLFRPERQRVEQT